jgi:hypothetical protein
MKRSLADQLKFVTVKSKYRQARLSKLRKLIQGIPTKVQFNYYDDEVENAYDKGRYDLANEIRAILNDDPFAGKDHFRPGRNLDAINALLGDTK